MDDLSHTLTYFMSAVISAVSGGCGVAFIVRYFVTRTIGDLAHVVSEVGHLTSKLAVIEEQLKTMTTIKKLLLEHDRQIIELATRTGHGGISKSRPESAIGL